MIQTIHLQSQITKVVNNLLFSPLAFRRVGITMESETSHRDSAPTPVAAVTYGLRRRLHKNLNENAICAVKEYLESDSESESEPESNFKRKRNSVSKTRRKKLASPANTTLESIGSGNSSDCVTQSPSTSKDLSLPCPKCAKIFKRPRYLNRHLKFTHAIKKPSIQCKLCSKALYDGYVLKRHMETVHNSNSKKFEQKCIKCSLIFTDPKSLKHHYCNTNSDSPPTLKQFPTILIQAGPDKFLNLKAKSSKFKCKHCGKNFARLYVMKQHMQMHTGRKSKCSICSKSFNLHSSLKAHINRHHPKAALLEGEDGDCNDYLKSYKCQHCPKTFNFKHGLQIHERKHTSSMPFGCPICTKRFSDPYEVKYHIMRHTGEKPFKCTEQSCGKAYIKRSYLTQHMRIHTGELPYICRICKKAFRLSSHQLRHEKNVHHFVEPRPRRDAFVKPPILTTSSLADDPNSVNLANKAAKKRPQNLVAKKHGQKRKTGIFSCSLCGKSFRTNYHCRRQPGVKRSFLRHESTVHKDQKSQTISEEIHAAAELTSTARINTTDKELNTELEDAMNSIVEDIDPVSEDCQINRVMLDEFIVKDENMDELLLNDNGGTVAIKIEDSKTEPIPTILLNVEVPVQPAPMYCPYCYISVQNNAELEEHGRISHATHTGSESDKLIFTCPHLYCGSKLSSISELKIHQRIIHKLTDS